MEVVFGCASVPKFDFFILQNKITPLEAGKRTSPPCSVKDGERYAKEGRAGQTAAGPGKNKSLFLWSDG